MNKRFFTLMAAVLLAGAPLANQAFALENSITVVDVNANLELANGVKFVLKRGSDYVGKAVVKNTAANATYATSTSADVALEDAAVFEVTNYAKNALGVTFQLTVDGLPFALADGGNSLQAGTPKTEIFTIYSATPASGTKYLMKGLTLKYQTTTGFDNFTSCDVKTISLDYNADNLKEFNSSSTTFSFDAESLEGNVFQSVTPFTFAEDALADGSAKGTYFVSGAAADIKKLKEATDPAGRAAALKKLNVVYVKNELWGLNTKGTAEGYKVVTISGAEFYKEAPAKAAYFDNAAFTSIVEGDQLNNEGAVVLTIKPIVGANDKTHKSVTVAAVKASASDTKAYVTTVANVAGENEDSQFKTIINPTLGANTYFAASEFLNAAGASVYNIYFTNGDESIKDGNQTQYHKYLNVSDQGASFGLAVSAANDVDLTSPLSQWVVTNFDGKYKLTLQNRQVANQKLELKLAATNEAGVYTTTSSYMIPTTGGVTTAVNLNKTAFKLIPATVTKTDGYVDLTKEEMAEGIKLAFTGKNSAIGEKTFYASLDVNAKEVPVKLYPTLKESEATSLKIAKSQNTKEEVDYIQHYTTYAYLNANGSVAYKENGDTLVVPTYKIYVDYYNTTTDKVEPAYLFGGKLKFTTTASSANAYAIHKVNNDTYTLSYFDTAGEDFDAMSANWTSIGVKNSSAFDLTDQFFAPQADMFSNVAVSINDNSDKTTLEAEPRYVTFDNFRGSVSFEENENGILAGILSAEPMTFHLDTADSDAKTPSFYISKGIAEVEEEAPVTKAEEAAIKMRNFMFFPVDSATIFDEGSATADTNWDYILEGTENELKAIFRPAAIVAEDTLATVVDGKDVTVVAKDADASKGQVNGLNRFQFGICLADEDYEGYYVIYPKADAKKYLYTLNGILGYTEDPNKALVVTLGEGDPTANEAIAAESGVQVIGGQGVVTVQGAAGKVVTVANILGQTIANQVAASDNVTIAVPAGIVVVAVDGEATKVVVK